MLTLVAQRRKYEKESCVHGGRGRGGGTGRVSDDFIL